MTILLLLPRCAAPPPPPPPPPIAAPPDRGLLSRIDAILRSTPDAGARAEEISRLIFGELRLQESRTCLEIGLACTSAGGLLSARTPHHMVVLVPGDGGPIFLDPANPGAMLDAEALRRAHPWPANPRAERLYGRALTRGLDADVDADRAASLIEQGDVRGALEATRAALALEPDLPEAHVAQGLVDLRRGEPEDAARALDQALAVLPDDPQILYDRGVAAAALGDRDGARRFFEATLRVDPGHAKARADLEAISTGR